MIAHRPIAGRVPCRLPHPVNIIIQERFRAAKIEKDKDK